MNDAIGGISSDCDSMNFAYCYALFMTRLPENYASKNWQRVFYCAV